MFIKNIIFVFVICFSMFLPAVGRAVLCNAPDGTQIELYITGPEFVRKGVAFTVTSIIENAITGDNISVADLSARIAINYPNGYTFVTTTSDGKITLIPNITCESVISFDLIWEDSNTLCTSDPLTFTSIALDLDIDSNKDGVIDASDEATESSIGGIVKRDGLAEIKLTAGEPSALVSGTTLVLSDESAVSRVEIFEYTDGQYIPVSLPASWTIGTHTVPPTLIVKGTLMSMEAQDVKLRLTNIIDGNDVSDEITLSVINFDCDLDIDTDNSGSITEADDSLEAEYPGMLVYENNDHDNGNINVEDCSDSVINGTDDLSQLLAGPMKLSLSGAFAGDCRVELKVSNMSKVRVFLKTGATTVPSSYSEIIGPNQSSWGSNLTINQFGLGDKSFLLEGVSPGGVLITFIVKLPDGEEGVREVFRDTVRVTVLDPDLDLEVDSDNSGVIDANDDTTEDATDNFLLLNDNHDGSANEKDCENEIIDGSDDFSDLRKMQVNFDFGTAQVPENARMTLSVTDPSKVRIYKYNESISDTSTWDAIWNNSSIYDDDNWESIVGPTDGGTWQETFSNIPLPGKMPLLIEGVDNGSVEIQIAYKIKVNNSYVERKIDKVGITVVSIDLDVDSDSDDGSSLTGDEDEDEIEESSPGKLVWVGDEFYETAAMVLRLEPDSLPDDAKISLSVDGEGEVMIFMQDAESSDPEDYIEILNSREDSTWSTLLSEVALPDEDLNFCVVGADSGEVEVTAELRIPDGDEGYAELCHDKVVMTVNIVDLDADSDRNGIVGGTAEAPELAWSEDAMEMSEFAVMVSNGDDDDDDNVFDCFDGTITAEDVADISELVIHKIPYMPSGWKAVLSIDSDDTVGVNVFDGITASSSEIMGPDPLGDSYEIPDISSDLRFGIEARTYKCSLFDGDVTVCLTIIKEDGTDYISDSVRVKVAPVIFFSGLSGVDKIYVSDKDDQFVADLKDAVGAARVEEVLSSDYNDVWVQDAVEIGYVDSPKTGPFPAAYRMPRDNPLQEWPGNELWGPDFGLFWQYYDAADYIKGNMGGNLEVVPPHSKSGIDYPFGRVIVGNTMSNTLKDFINLQSVQAPLITVDVSWLTVGHVDEVIGFIQSEDSYKVLIADTTEAYDIISDLVVTDGGTAIGGGTTVLQDDSKDWDDNEWVGGFIEIVSGSGAGQVRQIYCNTDTMIFPQRSWVTAPGTDSVYKLVARSAYNCLFINPDGEDLGVVSSSGSHQIVDASKQWPTGEWNEGIVYIVEGKGAGQKRRISYSSTETLNVYTPWDNDMEPNETSKYVVTKSSKISYDYLHNTEFAAIETPVTILNNIALSSQNLICQSYIDSEIYPVIADELGLSEDDFIRIPELFIFDNLYSGYGALIPDMVNCLIDGNNAVVAKPFGPVVNGKDVFEEYVKSAFGAGYTVSFIDDWDTYHRKQGEVHCGTNTKRIYPEKKWYRDE